MARKKAKSNVLLYLTRDELKVMASALRRFRNNS